MSQYFISGASGPPVAGQSVEWEFADVGAKVKLDVLDVVPNEKLVWESSALGQRARTTITFQADGPDATVVIVNESAFDMTEEGVKLAMGQTAGWTYTLCALKAYVQFGINLRTGLDRRITDVAG